MGVGETARSRSVDRSTEACREELWFGTGCKSCGATGSRPLDEDRLWLGSVCESCGSTVTGTGSRER